MFSYYFFFQAEDGIRDYKVTGVQTCALPILKVKLKTLPDKLRGGAWPSPARAVRCPVKSGRSEERRVGKECRSWWGAHNEKKKAERGKGKRGAERVEDRPWSSQRYEARDDPD